MSIATEISRLKEAKAIIHDKLDDFGLVTNSANLNTLANAIDGIENCGNVSLEVVEGESINIPAGYHKGGGVVVGKSNTAGDAETYRRQVKTGITPQKGKEVHVTPDSGYYALESVTVDPIPDRFNDTSGVKVNSEQMLAGNVAIGPNGETIDGRMNNNGNIDRVLDTANTFTTIDEGYHAGSGTVRIDIDTKPPVEPTKEVQDIVPDAGKVLGKVTVAPIPEKYIDTTETKSPASAENILVNKVAYVNGAKVKGTMKDLGSATMSFDGLTTTQITVDAGYTSGGTISLTDDIETELAKI